MKKIYYTIALSFFCLGKLFGQDSKILKRGDFDYYRHDYRCALVFKGDKCGVSDFDGNLIIPIEYEDINYFNRDNYQTLLYEAKKNGKWGCIDSQNNVLVPFVYDEVSAKMDYAIVKLGQKWQTIDFLNKVLWENCPNKWHFNDEFAVLKQTDTISNVFGLFNKFGKQIHDYNLSGDFIFCHNFAKSLYGNTLISKFGENIVFPELYITRVFTNENILVRNKGKMALMNKKGNLIIPFDFDDFDEYYSEDVLNLIAFKKNGKWGVYDIEGKYIIPFEYDKIKAYKNFIILKKNNISSVFNIKLNKIVFDNCIDCELENVRYLEKVIRVTKNDKYGLIDFEGNILADFTYGNVNTNYNTILVQKGTKYGLLDSTGKKVILPFEYDLIDYDAPFRLSNIILSKGEKYGLNDCFGKPLISLEYDYLNNEKHLIYKAKIGEKVGLINESNKIIIPIDYDEIIGFSNVELFTCKKNGLQGVFDHKGNQILPLDYQSIKVYGWHNIIQQNGKFGLFDKYKRKITIPCEYDEIDDKSPSGSILICKKNEKKGAFIRDKEFIPCIYDEIIEEHSNRQYRYVAKKGNQTTIFTYPLDCE